MKGREKTGLFEVDEPVENGYYIVDAENEGVENTGGYEFEAAVEVVELCEGEEYEA